MHSSTQGEKFGLLSVLGRTGIPLRIPGRMARSSRSFEEAVNHFPGRGEKIFAPTGETFQFLPVWG